MPEKCYDLECHHGRATSYEAMMEFGS
ncbi:MAG: hypothetical protein HW374_2175, partial [Bacteroidetes bacterium]|nr:hypothetical protein [Bacteroidota bacterium]